MSAASRRHSARAAALGVLLLIAREGMAQVNFQPISLHSVGQNSRAHAAHGSRQVGEIYSSGFSTPATWNSTSQSINIYYLGNFGWDGGRISGVSADHEVGSVLSLSGNPGHAALWSGSAESFRDLHPIQGNYRSSSAGAISGSQVVGTAYTSSLKQHAALWDLETGEFRDLHPSGASYSALIATDGARQGGVASFNRKVHALIWNGAPNDYVDITPSGAVDCTIRFMTADTQVGRAVVDGGFGAALWHNTAESFVNMAPPNSVDSEIETTLDGLHGGSVYFTGLRRAAIWISDSPDGFVDMHAFLPHDYTESAIEAIGRVGDTFYVSGWAQRSDHVEAMLWVGTIPAPGSLAIALLFGLTALSRRRR
ncbi:MAG: hypothetical protein HUU19_01330 [Phycisphaerales bacterium]|nr:hypothetical protein [Phycisphaerales bacterium]